MPAGGAAGEPSNASSSAGGPGGSASSGAAGGGGVDAPAWAHPSVAQSIPSLHGNTISVGLLHAARALSLERQAQSLAQDKKGLKVRTARPDSLHDSLTSQPCPSCSSLRPSKPARPEFLSTRVASLLLSALRACI